MTNFGQTVSRFAGALLLAAGATGVDHPGLLFSPDLGPVETVPVVVASKDIPEGAIIDRLALTVAQWPMGTVPAGAYASVDSVAHRVSRIAIYKGEAIVPGRLAPVGTAAGLEVKITPGKRAFSIRVTNDAPILVDQVQPNSRVDIMLVIDDPESPGKRVAKRFMANMRVLAIGPLIQRSAATRATGALIVTIEVTSYEAEALAVAASREQLSIVLHDPYASASPSYTRAIPILTVPAPIVVPPPAAVAPAQVQRLPLHPRGDRTPSVRRTTGRSLGSQR
ncbi:MAG TPA: Flp pilus assembly protein CpaB [Gemmatimonadaceae bacterium]|nr:Flp pilus assembly protein CpaB [Gemmatimonadaceae bacterium]